MGIQIYLRDLKHGQAARQTEVINSFQRCCKVLKRSTFSCRVADAFSNITGKTI